MLLTEHLAASGAFDQHTITVLDVGAAGGFDPRWKHFGNAVQLIGFEPGAVECQRLNAVAALNERYYPVALDAQPGERQLHITAWPRSSSFYEANMAFVSRLPDDRNLRILGHETVTTIDLDSFLTEHGIAAVDFIKLDVEGAELDVLRGAERIMQTVIGVSIEVLFQQMHIGRPLFSDVDTYLRRRGFALYDLTQNRHARKVLSPRMFSDRPGRTENGQVLWGQALYLRDPVATPDDGWDALRTLKLAAYMELCNLQDCAAELVLWAEQRGLLDSAAEYLDLLAPGGSYQGYLQRLRDKEAGHQPLGRRALRATLRAVLPRPVRNKLRRLLLDD